MQCGGSGGDSCLLGCVRGVESLWAHRSGICGSFPTHLSALRIRQRTLQLQSREILEPVFDIIANITCSKGRRHASRTSLIMELGAGGSSVFVRGLSIKHRRGRYSDCINPRLFNSSHLSACIYTPGLRSLVLTTLLTRNKSTRSSIHLNYPPSLFVSLTSIEYASETFRVSYLMLWERWRLRAMISACVYSRDQCILEGSSRVCGLSIRPLTAAFIRQGRFITGSTLFISGDW